MCKLSREDPVTKIAFPPPPPDEEDSRDCVVVLAEPKVRHDVENEASKAYTGVSRTGSPNVWSKFQDPVSDILSSHNGRRRLSR